MAVVQFSRRAKTGAMTIGLITLGIAVVALSFIFPRTFFAVNDGIAHADAPRGSGGGGIGPGCYNDGNAGTASSSY